MWQGQQVVSMRVEDLTPLVGLVVKRPQFLADLESSLAAEGMRHPLLVAYATPAQTLTACGDVRGLYIERPEHPALFVVVGNQRFWLLRDAGYTHLPCVFFSSIGTCRKMGSSQRRDWETNLKPSHA